jgi:hypothetical protein
MRHPAAFAVLVCAAQEADSEEQAAEAADLQAHRWDS